MHPTKRLLIQTTVGLLSEFTSRQITAEQVLELSHVSKGSMYHHFADFGDLLEAAQVERFSLFVANLVAVLRAVLNEGGDVEAARAKFHDAAEYRESDAARNMRIERLGTILEANHNPRLAKKFAAAQSDLTRMWMELYHDCISKGWAEPKLDPLAVAVLMQSTIAGRIVDDISEIKMEKENWVRVIQYLLDVTFFANVPKTSAD